LKAGRRIGSGSSSLRPCEEVLISALEEGGEGGDVIEAEEEEDPVLLKDGGVGERLELDDEGKFLKRIGDPTLPSAEEVETHCLRGHIPYRNWCPVCVRAQGRDHSHKRDPGGERELAEYSWDYCFPGDELGFKWTVLVGRERDSKSWMATTVPHKGGIGRFGRDKCLEFIEENGDTESKVIVKTDQEPSILVLVKELVEGRKEGRTLIEEAQQKQAKYMSSGSNGVVERGVQEMEGEIRKIYLGLENRLGFKVNAKERIIALIPEYAAYLMNRLKEGSDGKVAYQRIKGKKPSVLAIEFGEKVFYKVKMVSKLEKLNARWEPGIFVGVKRKSNEIMVATEDGILFVRAIRRVAKQQRWTKDSLSWVKWAPWHRYKDADDADGEVPEGVPAVDSEERLENSGERLVFIETRERAPREFFIKQEDCEKYGYTEGCAGCSSWFKGRGRQPHTRSCRERLRGCMQDEARVIFSEKRRQEFADAELLKRNKKEAKRSEMSELVRSGNASRKGKRKADEEIDEERLGGSPFEEQEDRERMKRKAETEVEVDEEAEILKALMEYEAQGSQEVEMDISLVENWTNLKNDALSWVNEIIHEVEDCGESGEEADLEGAWDDVHGGELPLELVKDARHEEVGYMQGRHIWTVTSVSECWEKTGKAPVSVRWVDTNKGGPGEMNVRCRLVARHFKGGDKDRDDLFAATPPLEGKRMLISRAATRRGDGRRRKLMFIDAKKAHLNPECDDDVYIELPAECGEKPAMCGKPNFWVYGFR